MERVLWPAALNEPEADPRADPGPAPGVVLRIGVDDAQDESEERETERESGGAESEADIQRYTNSTVHKMRREWGCCYYYVGRILST